MYLAQSWMEAATADDGMVLRRVDLIVLSVHAFLDRDGRHFPPKWFLDSHDLEKSPPKMFGCVHSERLPLLLTTSTRQASHSI